MGRRAISEYSAMMGFSFEVLDQCLELQQVSEFHLDLVAEGKCSFSMLAEGR